MEREWRMMPPEKAEFNERVKPTFMSIPTFIKRMFFDFDSPLFGYSKIARRYLPYLINRLLGSIENLCEYNPYSIEGFEDAFAFIRGSCVKREILGTPSYYWFVSPWFERYQQDSEIQSNPILRKTVEKLVIGPRDLDIVYCLKPGVSYEALFDNLCVTLRNSGFKSPGIVELQTNLFGAQEKRTVFTQGRKKVEIIYYQKGRNKNNPQHFIKISFFIDDTFLMKIDLVNMPKEEQFEEDFRFTGAMSLFDQWAVAKLNKRKKGVWVTIDAYAKKLAGTAYALKLRYQNPTKFHHFYALLRDIGNVVFWPTFRQGDRWNMRELLDYFNLVGLCQREPFERLEVPQERLPDVFADFLAYISYSPFLFLTLAYHTNLISAIPLGNYIKNWEDLYNVLYEMAAEMDLTINIPYKGGYQRFEDYFIQDPIGTLQYATDVYQKNFLVLYKQGDIKNIGPFLLVRAINNVLRKRGLGEYSIPLTFQSITELFNPNFVDKINETLTPDV